MGQQLPTREFRMDLVQLQRIPNLLRLIAESTLWDTREEANLVPGIKMSWDESNRKLMLPTA